ncbi:MAG: nicotinate-nucleotide adenylyltransferase, partial [Halobacteriales archaeon SW_9_67_25]
MIDRGRLRGTHIRENMIAGDPWQDRVPEAVVGAVPEIDGVARLRRIADTDGESGGDDDPRENST